MRKFILGIAIVGAACATPGIAGAEPPPNGRNCVGIADSAGAQAGGFGTLVSGLATSGPGAVAESLAEFVAANCTRSGPG